MNSNLKKLIVESVFRKSYEAFQNTLEEKINEYDLEEKNGAGVIDEIYKEVREKMKKHL